MAVRKGHRCPVRIDPTPFEIQVRVLEAQLASAEGANRQLQEQLRAAVSATRSDPDQKLDLAQTRAGHRTKQLAQSGAGDVFRRSGCRHGT